MDEPIAGQDVRNSPRSNWRVRRRLIWLTVLFCMSVITYVIWRDSDTKLADSAMTMAFLLLGSTLGSYVFGATYEDLSVTKLRLQSPPPP